MTEDFHNNSQKYLERPNNLWVMSEINKYYLNNIRYKKITVITTVTGN